MSYKQSQATGWNSGMGNIFTNGAEQNRPIITALAGMQASSGKLSFGDMLMKARAAAWMKKNPAPAGLNTPPTFTQKW